MYDLLVPNSIVKSIMVKTLTKSGMTENLASQCHLPSPLRYRKGLLQYGLWCTPVTQCRVTVPTSQWDSVAKMRCDDNRVVFALSGPRRDSGEDVPPDYTPLPPPPPFSHLTAKTKKIRQVNPGSAGKSR